MKMFEIILEILINQIKFLYTINFSIHAVYTNMFLIPLKTYLFFVDVK